MTDKEIREDLAKQIARENRAVLIDLPPHGPPLMLVSERHIPTSVIERIRQEVTNALAAQKPMVFDGCLVPFQLIDGVWTRIE